jgi:hypothetical protein
MQKRKLPMKRVLLLVACVVMVLVAGLTFHARANDDKTFNNHTLNDKYGFHVLALSLDPSNTLGASNPFAVSGYYEFHGDGTLNGADTVSRNGSIIPRRYTGTYQVNSDGTGTLTLEISTTFQPVGNFVIVDNGRAIEIILPCPET